ncbi:hypothetical protein [Pseudomonas phage D6]|nr:hypothetical protein [Pseudomonas phage D6]
MAKKVKLTKLIASLESEDGVARPVEVKETSSSLGKNEVQDVADDGSGKGDVAEAAYEVEVDGKDFTAIDEASKRQGEAIHKQMERLDEACASTEAYLEILRGSTRYGLEAATASVIAHDLKSMYPKFFSKLTTSLEAIDDDAGPLRIGHTKEAEKEATGKLAKLKGKTKEVWAKFWEWIKKRWNELKSFFGKIKKLFTKEKAKTQFLLGVAKSSNPSSVKLDQEGAEGTKTAAAIKAIGHEKPAPKVEKEERKPEPVKLEPLPKEISVPEAAYINSVENDWQGVGRWEDSQLRSISQNWVAITLTRIKAISSALASDTKAGGRIKEAVEKDPVKKLSTAVGASNKVLEVEGGGFKLVDGDYDKPDSTDFKVISRDDCWKVLDRAMLTYENIEELEEVKGKIEHAVEQLQVDLEKTEVVPEVRQIVTTYLRSVLNSDWAGLVEHGMRACKARRAIADAMIAAHIRAEGK